jgi:hypothetical protein
MPRNERHVVPDPGGGHRETRDPLTEAGVDDPHPRAYA